MIIAIDFDGTLFTEGWPSIGKPKRFTIWLAKRKKRQGHTLILNTCREGERLTEALAACAVHGLYFDFVNENDPKRIKLYGGDCRKISADEYWDDKARRIR